MLAKEVAGESYSKSNVRSELLLGALKGRTPGSVEYRMQNISAVLQQMGKPWIQGYKPAANVGPVNADRIRSLLLENDGLKQPDPLAAANLEGPTLSSVVPTLGQLMGVKAVWGSISSYVLCFGGRGGTGGGDANYYSLPAAAAQKATKAPFVIAIGGGEKVQPGLEGRVLNLARVSTVYGKTELFVGQNEGERLAQWPVALALIDVWNFKGSPHLVADLGFADRTILAGAQDGITRREGFVDQLWEALKSWPLVPAPLPALANFYESGAPKLVHSILPKPLGGDKGEEGKKIYVSQLALERDPKLRKEARRLNLSKNGRYTCEACLFAHDDPAMFDVHHPTPLCAGVRTTFAEHLELLCPTCHRRAHRKSRLDPYSLSELRDWNSNGRP